MATRILLFVVAFAAGAWIDRAFFPHDAQRTVYAGTETQARPESGDLAGIDALHRKDVAATLSGNPDELAELWTDDAVRLNPGESAEVGKATIHELDALANSQTPGEKVLSYIPHIEDVQVIDGWAVEWGNFDGSFQASPKQKPQTVRGKMLRVLRRQEDGSWKFARVMWNENAKKQQVAMYTDSRLHSLY